MIKALFLDVDGTLISFRTHAIPSSAIDALLEAHRRGVRIFIATGRAAADLELLSVIPYDGVVALNGSDCRMRGGESVSKVRIPHADFLQALALGRRLDFPVALELDEGVFVDRVTPTVEELARLVAHPVPVETDLQTLFDRSDCCQLCFYLDPEQEQQAMAELPGLIASRWCPLFVDVNVRGVDKATGMESFMTHFGFAADEVMAFGDGGNDVPMLRAAGVGVAMGNACAEALAVADYVTASVDDHGIRRALEYYKVID